MTDSLLTGSNIRIDEPVDTEIYEHLNPKKPVSFFLFAGAGSGKTRSLVNALNYVRDNHGHDLGLHGRKMGVITYTNAACDEISRRIDFHPLFHVSTIHSFAWELIKGFDNDIREWLKENLDNEIKCLLGEEGKGRAGTKASIERQTKIKSKQKRRELLDTITAFTYDPSNYSQENNSLNHSEVIKICAQFLSEKEIMQWIMIGRFPFLLIDESQDTNRHLIDALFIVEKNHSNQFLLGLFGDTMQRIYADGKEQIESELPQSWGKPSKKLNHRCPRRVVQLINKIREEVDNHVQEPRSDADEGYVRFFIRPMHVDNCQQVEDTVRDQMANVTGDAKWNERHTCKILTLEHHMAAKRLGFEDVFNPLYRIDRWRTSLLDGTLPALHFFSQSVLPLAKAGCNGDKFSISRIMRSKSPLLTPQRLKEAADAGEQLKNVQSGVEELSALWNGKQPSCGEVLLCLNKNKLFNIPDSLKPIIPFLERADILEKVSTEDDTVSDEMKALLDLMKSPFEQIDTYLKYVSGLAPFDTHQGVKGLEFERVMVIMDDFEARGFMFGYEKLFGSKNLSETDIKNIGEGRDSSIDRTRRLLYVTCSRAVRSLSLVVYSENPEAVKNHVIRNGWFEENEVDLKM